MEGAAQVKQSTEQTKLKAEQGGVVVLDFGGQYTQLIARRVREQQVFSAILPCTTPLEEIRKLEPAGIILSGGPSSVYDKDAPKCDPAVLATGDSGAGDLLRDAVDCEESWRESGAGREARIRTGAVEHGESGEPHLFKDFPDSLKIWNSHGDNVLELPPGFHLTGKQPMPLRQRKTPNGGSIQCSFTRR